MKLIAIALIAVLGAYSLAGGIAGYVFKRSTASLIAGGVSGLLLLVLNGCVWAAF